MTRISAGKPADAAFGAGRLQIARAYLESARTAVLLPPGHIGNPAMSQIVNAAIAFTDALTATYAGRVNQQDHAAAIGALRHALGNRLPQKQETHLRRILDQKDEVQYGVRVRSPDDASTMLDHLAGC